MRARAHPGRPRPGPAAAYEGAASRAQPARGPRAARPRSAAPPPPARHAAHGRRAAGAQRGGRTFPPRVLRHTQEAGALHAWQACARAQHAAVVTGTASACPRLHHACLKCTGCIWCAENSVFLLHSTPDRKQNRARVQESADGDCNATLERWLTRSAQGGQAPTAHGTALAAPSIRRSDMPLAASIAGVQNCSAAQLGRKRQAHWR